ncbi:zinc carboxypeptidase [Dictyocaulus viviparus]|uniref:Zinc carboxypeptidase n=1 Tax=Dictyocaulus viviparus TaxID=29172 RepID=A0A0D8Y8B9_DICVI|nr:zinc carboxypeptidase [Dictyocaulus viviparus]
MYYRSYHELLDTCSGETSQASIDGQSNEYLEESSDDQDEVLPKFDEDCGPIVNKNVQGTNSLKVDVVHSRLRISDLQSYGCYFDEYEHGAEAKHYKRELTSYSESFQQNMLATRSVIPFIKVAFPESQNPDIESIRQRHYEGVTSMRDVVAHEIARANGCAEFQSRVVFNLDAFVVDLNSSKPPSLPLTCNDCSRIGQLDSKYDHLLFESRFESGNLRRATQIGPNYYELILSPDINQRKQHYQWFYFEVSNIINDVVYTFEIVNCLKPTSMYNKGMQPVMYSVGDAITGHPGWVRVGESLSYYRNLYTSGDCCETDENTPKKRYVSTPSSYYYRMLSIVMKYVHTTIARCLSQIPDNLYYSNRVIGESLGGNPVNLLTITASCSTSDIISKDCIFLSSRVHPGESNASWMMHGILETLLMSSEPLVEEMRQKFVFKIVPILNPDGVVNGSHRCSLSGNDLNRVWDRPDRTIHPEVYHTKAVIQYMCDMLKRPPFIFVDLHGHSRRANVFMFGNDPKESWRAEDKTLPHNYDFMKLPEVLEKVCCISLFPTYKLTDNIQ